MQLLAIRTRIFKPRDDLVSVVMKSLRTHDIALEDHDILAISSKVVASTEARIVLLGEISPSEAAR